MRSKKGIELSVNFLVVIIFSIAVLFFGLMLAKGMFSKATEFQAEIDRGTQAEIEAFLAGGSRVGIPLNKAIISRGDTKVFGLGVLNTMQNDGILENREFVVSVVAKDNGNNDDEISVLPALRVINLDTNLDAAIPIAIRVNGNAKKGIHVIDVNVCYETTVHSSDNPPYTYSCNNINGFDTHDKYGTPQKIYVTVK